MTLKDHAASLTAAFGCADLIGMCNALVLEIVVQPMSTGLTPEQDAAAEEANAAAKAKLEAAEAAATT
jgi:hypothetical protein